MVPQVLWNAAPIRQCSSGVNLIHWARRLVGVENLSDFRAEKVFQIRAEDTLHAAELCQRLAKVTVTEGYQQFMRPLIAIVHEHFHRSFPSLHSNRQWMFEIVT